MAVTAYFNRTYSAGFYHDLSETTYLTVHNAASCGVLFTNPTSLYGQQTKVGEDRFYIYRSALYFNTASLPDDAIISSAKLRIYVESSDALAQIQNGQPTYPHNPAEKADYLYSHYSGNGGDIPIYGSVGGAWREIDLTEEGIGWINLTGETRLVIRLVNDINAVEPTGSEGLWFRNDSGHYARLEVTYTVPVAEVTTEAASSVGIDHAKGNGTATGDDITERGFEVKLAFAGTLYEYISHHIAGFSTGSVSLVGTTWVGTIVKTVSEEGTFAAESFVGDLGRFPIAVHSDKLFAGETYDYRARATIDGTMYYGDWVEFTTNTYPEGGGPDDQIPIEDIISIEPPEEPIVPFEPPIEPIEEEEFPPIEFPEFEFPEFTYPEIPPYNGSWLGWFYYRKAYTKRDLDELRKKCRIFQDNSVEYALVINHNARVLQQFLNTMTIYMDADEHNTFRPIIPPQHLNELAREPLNVLDFKEIINNFINNSIDNANNVNNNFHLIRDGLSDYTYTEDEGFIDISITTRLVEDNNPDVDGLKKVIDRANKEMSNNYAIINHNLHVLRAMLI